MTRGVFNWTAEDVIRFLRGRDFVLQHTRGSHFYYRGVIDGTVRIVTVPFHGQRSLKPRVFKGIVLQSGIPMEEWRS